MKVALFTLDQLQFPSAQIRLVEPFRQLAGAARLLNGIQMVQQNIPFDDVDVIILQRGLPRPHLKELCAAILASGKPVIYETDDLLQRVPAHHNKPDYNEELARNIEWLAREADVVTVSTPLLGEYYGRMARHVVVLPNYLSPRLWRDSLVAPADRSVDRVRLGLVGSKNHDRDFALAAGLIGEALDHFPDVDCMFYGAMPAGIVPGERISLTPADYVYDRHPGRLAGLSLDIALVPLVPDDFNRAKSNIKFLEFGFLGIPGLYADLEPYRGTVVHGENGFLCDDTPAAWRDALFRLIENAVLRRRIGDRARQDVVACHMLGQHAHRWLEACQRAIDVRAGRSR